MPSSNPTTQKKNYNSSITRLKFLSDADLDKKTKQLSKQEQDLTLRVLQHLQEIDRRKLFAKRGYPSLFSYVVKELGYCEASASQRIQAMRLMSHSREAKREIEKGTLKLSQAARIQTFMRAEKKENGRTFSKEETRELIQKVSGLSLRQTVEKLKTATVALKFPALETTETISFEADEELKAMIERVRELKGNLELSELLKLALRMALGQIDPLRKKVRKGRVSKGGETDLFPSNHSPVDLSSKTPIHQPSRPSSNRLSDGKVKNSKSFFKKSQRTASRAHEISSRKSTKHTRYVTQYARALVNIRSGAQCEFVDHQTNRRCESRYRLQYDHIRAHSRGGSSEAENLQHLCAVHNGLKGTQTRDYRWRDGN